MKLLKKYGVYVLVTMLLIIFFLGMRWLHSTLDDNFSFSASSQTVIKELKALNRLETASFTIEKVIDAGTQGNQLQDLLFGDRLLLIAHGEVISGFDLSQLQEDAISVEGETLKLTLPPPQILTIALNSDQTRVYDRQTGVFSKGDKDLEAAARSEAESIIRQAACTGGILKEAEKNGRSQLTTLFKALGFTTVILTIPNGKC